MPENLSNNTMTSIKSPEDFIDNLEEITNFSKIVYTDNQVDISNLISNFLFDKYKIVKETVYRLNPDNKLWQLKNKNYLKSDIGDIFNNCLKEFKKLVGDKPTEEQMKLMKGLLKYTKTPNISQLIDLVLNNLTPLYEDKFIQNLDSSPYELPLTNKKIINLKHKIVRTRGNPSELLYLLNNDMIKYKPFEKDGDYFTFEIEGQLVEDLSVPQEFYKSLMCGNETKTKYLQQILGSCLLNANPSSSFCIFTGSGSNGKTLMIKIMDYFLEKVSTSIDPNLIIENSANKFSSSNSANPFLVKLENKRFIYLSETKNNDKIKEDFLKKMTGDDKITCRDLYAKTTDIKEIQVRATPILVSNYKPTFDISSHAMLRRFKHIDFNAKFLTDGKKPTKKGEYEANLNYWDDVFLPNKDAFFSWLVEGAYSHLNENLKLEPPEEIQKEILSYISEIDIVRNFFETCLKVSSNPKIEIKKPVMYDNFKTYCEDMGKPFKGKKDFYAEFDKILKPFKNSVEVYRGYEFILEDDEDEDIEKQL